MVFFENWKEEWLRENKDNLTTVTYYNHISKFVDYLKEIEKENTPRHVNIDDLINCIGYYNNLGIMNSINTMRLHVESIKVFYNYLLSKGQTDNIFAEIDDLSVFYKNIVDRFKLIEKKQSEFLEYDEIIELLKTFEQGILAENYPLLSKVQSAKYIRELGVCLYVKLSIIYPAKRQDICSLKISQFEDDFHELHIKNDYTKDLKLLLPNSFRKEIKKFIKQRELELGRKVEESESIFSFLCGEDFNFSKINSWLFSTLKRNKIICFENKKTDTYSAEAIRNTIITRMVKDGMNPALISKLSNMGIGTLEERYYKNGIVIENEEEIINLEISKMGLVNYL